MGNGGEAGPGNTGAKAGEKAMRVSLAAGILQLGVKAGAYAVTGSSAIFADAAESAIHLLAVCFAFASIKVSRKPPDRDHPYGHAKIGFFSSGVEGGVILVAALFIFGDAGRRLLAGPALDHPGLGIALTALTILMNGALGLWLIRTGKKEKQIILTANGWHVLTDAWTSFGVIAGLALAWGTGWVYWDPICAILVAVNILVTGAVLVRKGFSGLMDEADPSELKVAETFLEDELEGSGVSYHALRMRNLGNGISIDLHLTFDDKMSIREAHEFATALEEKLSGKFDPPATVMTHLEPRHDHTRLHGGIF